MRHVYPRVALTVLLMVSGLAACGPDAEPPAQPIAFDHSKHAANRIDCLQCHLGANKTARAGLPPLDTCASCHFGTIPDHPEVQKVLAHFDDKEPIRWVKVNVIPDSAMVHFQHKPHHDAGIECATCHGDVATMTVARPAVDLADMGFCLDCHRQRDASTDCLTCHH